jgi:hypothetical protein
LTALQPSGHIVYKFQIALSSWDPASPPPSQYVFPNQITVAKMSIFEIVARFSIQHFGPETTYEIFTSLILLYARIRQLQILLGSISPLAYLMVPSTGAIIAYFSSSSVKMRFGCPAMMLVILKLAIDTELPSSNFIYC